MDLRVARSTDTSEIAPMLTEMLGGSDGRRQAEMEATRIVCGQSWDTVVLEADGRLAGFAATKLDPMEGFDSVAEIVFLYIRPGLRRTGVGSLFLEQTEHRLSQRMIQKVFVKVNAGNAAAVHFWIGNGYQFEGRISGAEENHLMYVLGKRIGTRSPRPG